MIPDYIEWKEEPAFPCKDPYTTTAFCTPEGEFRSLVLWSLSETRMSSSPWTLVYTNERSSPTEWETGENAKPCCAANQGVRGEKAVQETLKRVNLQRRTETKAVNTEQTQRRET